MIKPIIHNIVELRKPCIPVEPNEDVTQIIQDLKDTLIKNGRGYALAANQIGYNKCVCYIHLPTNVDPRTKKIEYLDIIAINPKIVSKGRPIIFQKEGCLSLPGLRIDTDRYVFCAVEYENEKRKTTTAMMQDLQAIVFQHEVAHLHGKTILDFKHRRK